MNQASSATTKATPAISIPQLLLVTLLAATFFGIVSPTSSNSLIIIVGSVTLGAALYVWFALFVRLFAMFWPFPNRQQRILAFILAVTAIFLVLMQSIGELSLRDAFAIVPLVVLLYAYISYASRIRPAQARQDH
jgi:hypothetical protein